ncbi:PPOX class F420-dependent oxidoreductase [Ktedonosporobacter rubrisoli]|uniref:PPOX class F420-dependent oxidoreductase n=1 Tax=Ktedonosporobacter rubrisoli TaxID=2509675 RepID=A0A4P6JUC0_KTERU|nr:PPOX class F420-dependent oxidoreductase [Ktedonosporobacter rubrisoli]QBD79064.1 PPOX class F420-dependent oxidoreductase [Ktedonosporobacter rubrisoli]
MFSAQERAYLQSQALARLGTVASNDQTDVDSVAFAFDGERFYIGGYFLENTRKYKNIASGQGKVCLLIDDLKTLEPFEPRGIKLHGDAEIATLQEGFRGPGTYLVITPRVSWSWGIEEPLFQNGQPAQPVMKKIRWK